MILLTGARLLVAFVPLNIWRARLGLRDGFENRARARLLAAHVEQAAARLPFACKCLVRAMALSWLLRRGSIAHGVVLAVRPPEMRGGSDDLHAWVEADGTCVLGDLPGPWYEIFRMPGHSGA